MRFVLLVCICCLLVTGCQSHGIQQRESAENKLPISIGVHRRTIIVPPGEVSLDGAPVHFGRSELQIPVSEGKTYLDEPFRLVALPQNGINDWRCAPNGAKVGGLLQPNVLVIDSLRLKRKPGKTSANFINRRDYIINSTWPLIYADADTNSKQIEEHIFIDYTVRQQRLWTLVVDKSGVLNLLPGPLSISSPTPPVVPAGAKAIANVLAPPFVEDLVEADVMPIALGHGTSSKGLAASNKSVAPIDSANQIAVSKTLAKLRHGQPVCIAFVGDSVTCGSCASSQRNSFPELFISQLSNKYPQTKITHFLVAKGGANSIAVFPMFLEKRSPHGDLIVIEFTNDVALDAQTLHKSYEPFLRKVLQDKSEVIICLPHLCNPTLHGFKPSDWQSVERKPFYTVIPEISTRYNVGCADVLTRSKNITSEGLTPTLLLADGQIHPNDRGHALYVDELMKFFR